MQIALPQRQIVRGNHSQAPTENRTPLPMPCMKNKHASALLTVMLILTACSGTGGSFPALSGPWLGCNSPGDEPRVFAPGIVSTGMFVRDITTTPAGDEIYWCVIGPNYGWTAIVGSKLEDGFWTEPLALPFTISIPTSSVNGSSSTLRTPIKYRRLESATRVKQPPE